MKSTLAVVSVAALVGASGLVAWSVLARPDATLLTSEQAHSFDFKEGPFPGTTIAPAPPPAEDLRDAVAAPVSPRPIPLDGMAVSAPRAAAAPRRVPVFMTPALESRVLHSKVVGALLRAPARLLVAAGPLRNPGALRAFLDDKKAVDAYMNSTLVRAALNSPAVAKAVLGSPALVRAFLGSPALRDPGTVRALLSSRMVVKMLDCPGVQEALGDPAVIKSMVADPGTLDWMSRSPEALQAISSAAPALAKSLAAAR